MSTPNRPPRLSLRNLATPTHEELYTGLSNENSPNNISSPGPPNPNDNNSGGVPTRFEPNTTRVISEDPEGQEGGSRKVRKSKKAKKSKKSKSKKSKKNVRRN